MNVPPQLLGAWASALLLLTSCASSKTARLQAEIDARSVIGHLRTRDQHFTVDSTSHAPRFDIDATRGRLLERELGLDQRAERYPSIRTLYDSAVVGGVAPLDARRRPAERSPDAARKASPPSTRQE